MFKQALVTLKKAGVDGIYTISGNLKTRANQIFVIKDGSYRNFIGCGDFLYSPNDNGVEAILIPVAKYPAREKKFLTEYVEFIRNGFSLPKTITYEDVILVKTLYQPDSANARNLSFHKINWIKVGTGYRVKTAAYLLRALLNTNSTIVVRAFNHYKKDKELGLIKLILFINMLDSSSNGLYHRVSHNWLSNTGNLNPLHTIKDYLKKGSPTSMTEMFYDYKYISSPYSLNAAGLKNAIIEHFHKTYPSVIKKISAFDNLENYAQFLDNFMTDNFVLVQITRDYPANSGFYGGQKIGLAKVNYLGKTMYCKIAPDSLCQRDKAIGKKYFKVIER